MTIQNSRPRLAGYAAGFALAVVAAFAAVADLAAEPTVPGFEVELYARVPGASDLAFAPDGVLYVGTEQPSHRIYRVGLGGAPVAEYGNEPFLHADGVLYDAAGGVSGVPGSVIVYGSFAYDPGQAHLSAIAPDGSTRTLFYGPPLVAPRSAAFDRYGRLLIGDFPGLWVTTGQELELLTPPGFGGSVDSANFFALDGAGRIFFDHEVGPDFDVFSIRVLSEQGVLDDEPFVWERPTENGHPLAFAPNDADWRGDLLAVSGSRWADSSTIRRIDPQGRIGSFGEGFPPGTGAPTFGPDGALYLCNPVEGVIYRITPASTVVAVVRALPYFWRDIGDVNVGAATRLDVYVFSYGTFDATAVVFDSIDVEGFDPNALRGPGFYDPDGDGLTDLQVGYRLDRMEPIPCGYNERRFSAVTTDNRQVTGQLKFNAVGCSP